MNKKYISPEIETIEFEEQDVVRTSGIGDDFKNDIFDDIWQSEGKSIE